MKTEKKKYLACLPAATIIMVLIFFQAITPAFGGQRFLPSDKVLIKSMYAPSSVQGLATDMTWELVCRMGKIKTTWAYARQAGDLYCTVSTDTVSQPPAFELFDKEGNLLESSLGGLVPVPGFPAPCQILNFPDFEGSGTFKIVRLAGGRRFATSFAYSCQTVEYEAAGENGWLNSDSAGYDPEKELIMVTIADVGSDIILIRQLWQENAAWWLYQETGIGRFWRQ